MIIAVRMNLMRNKYWLQLSSDDYYQPDHKVVIDGLKIWEHLLVLQQLVHNQHHLVTLADLPKSMDSQVNHCPSIVVKLHSNIPPSYLDSETELTLKLNLKCPTDFQCPSTLDIWTEQYTACAVCLEDLSTSLGSDSSWILQKLNERGCMDGVGGENMAIILG